MSGNFKREGIVSEPLDWAGLRAKSAAARDLARHLQEEARRVHALAAELHHVIYHRRKMGIADAWTNTRNSQDPGISD